ncbi:MAG: glycoside hydrolase family 3 N-terminal domain-containing protein [Chloroflexota bacterium]
MRNALLRLILFAALVCSLLPPASGYAAPAGQSGASQENALALLNSLTPEERVGQLFMVTFSGYDASSNTPIYNLLVKHHVGAVMMLNTNDNFLAPDVTVSMAQNLIRQLQLNEFNASQQVQTNAETGATYQDAYVPLFIATIQDGDGYPYDQILNGLSTLPNPMTIGATWDPEQAHKIGAILGDELSALGYNLLIGPSLDVLDSPNPESGGDLSVRTFGGDPFWVGQMGSAYIGGIHEGSAGHMAVIAKNFPGFGGADRPPEEEVATVRKVLEQLKQIELAPFFAVTGNAASPETTTDGLLVSHIRYQGFQGNIRETTKPVSFDAAALNQLTSLPAISAWREKGGVMVSADLGSRAVRRFYDPSGQTFNSQLVARDAFLAGNDLLYLGNFTASRDTDAYTSITNTLNFFTEKYREDEAFAQRVDESVLRILALKYRLYGGSFSISQVLMNENDLNRLNQANPVVLETASKAAVLISPDQSELTDTLPSPPARNDKIVFITDTRTFSQCSRCPEQFVMPVNALQSAVFRLYNRGGQVLADNLKSYSFQDLQNMLDAGVGVAQIENALSSADWIVFAMMDVTPSVPSSYALRNFLKERPELFQQKKLIVFAFTAPYYLDTTEISKLTAYYGLFSHGPNRNSVFADVAARLLFQEMRATGVLPVSVAGVYDLNQAVFPAAGQVIPLAFDYPAQESPAGTPTPEATPLPKLFQLNELVPVRTGTILDHNGKPVPDGTVVRFSFTRLGDNPIVLQMDASTIQGVARVTYRVENPGKWEARAESGEADESEVLPFEVPAPLNEATFAPTDTHTSVPPTATLTPEPSSTSEPPTATPPPTPTAPPPAAGVGFGDWLMAFLISFAIGISGYVLATRLSNTRWGVRFGLLALVGGIAAYTYLAFDLPGSQKVLENAEIWGVIALAVVGAITGCGMAWVWMLTMRSRPNGTK